MKSIRESIFKITAKLIELLINFLLLEIWHDDSMNATLRQIDYYRQSKIFPSEEYALVFIKNCWKWLNHIEKQAEAGL